MNGQRCPQPHGPSEPRPLRGLLLLFAGAGAVVIGLSRLLGPPSGLTSPSASEGFTGYAELSGLGGPGFALPGAVMACLGWRFLTR